MITVPDLSHLDREVLIAIEKNRQEAQKDIGEKVKTALSTTIQPVGWEILQWPEKSELSTLEERYTWQVIFPYAIKLLEQDSTSYVMKSRRTMCFEPEVPGYCVLNLLKRPDQKAYGAELLTNFFLFDFVDGIPKDQFISGMKDPSFFLAYAREMGAAYAKAYIIGPGGEYTQIITTNDEGMSNDVRFVDLTTAFYYSESDFQAIANAHEQIRRQGKIAGHNNPVLQNAATVFYEAFLGEYLRLQTLWTVNPDFLSDVFAKAPILMREGKDGMLLRRLDPLQTDADTLVQKIRQHET